MLRVHVGVLLGFLERCELVCSVLRWTDAGGCPSRGVVLGPGKGRRGRPFSATSRHPGPAGNASSGLDVAALLAHASERLSVPPGLISVGVGMCDWSGRLL